MPITTIGYQVICPISTRKEGSIIMIPITEKEENELDSGFLNCIKGECNFIVNANNIIAYGAIDFDDSSDDMVYLEDLNILEYMCATGICIPADYSYREHCCYSPFKRYRYYDTTNPGKVLQYKHAVLNKPERVAIFKYGKKWM